jgi:hypothetical protein
MSSSSSDHSVSACSKGLGFICGDGAIEAVEGSKGTTSAEGQVSLRDLRVESRTSVGTSAVSAWVVVSARGYCTPGDKVTMSGNAQAFYWVYEYKGASEARNGGGEAP